MKEKEYRKGQKWDKKKKRKERCKKETFNIVWSNGGRNDKGFRLCYDITRLMTTRITSHIAKRLLAFYRSTYSKPCDLPHSSWITLPNELLLLS